MVTFPMSFVRPLHYPPQRKVNGDEPSIGATQTSRASRSSVKTRTRHWKPLIKNGYWIPVPPIPRTFVINIEDYLQTLTNHRFDSTVHRVVNDTESERCSIAFFFTFNKDAGLEVLPFCREDGIEYEKKHTGTYMKERFTVARYKHPGPKAQ